MCPRPLTASVRLLSKKGVISFNGGVKMPRYQEILYQNKKVILADFSNSKPDEQLLAFPEIQEHISAKPEKSVLLLTDVSNAVYNSASSAAIKEWSSKNTPFVKASAVVGASGFLAVVLAGIRLFTGRDIRSFDSRNEALDWLVTVQ